MSKRIDFLKNKYKTIKPEHFNTLISLDPTQEKKFLDWMCRMVTKGIINPEEDNSKLTRLLVAFNKNKQVLSQKEKDINSFTSISSLALSVIEAMEKNKFDEGVYLKKGVRKIYEDEKWLIVKPFTKEASEIYGKGSQWCTASKGNNSHFYSYISRGWLYIIIDKTAKERSDKSKFQLFLDNNGVHCELNNAINTPVKRSDFFFRKF